MTARQRTSQDHLRQLCGLCKDKNVLPTTSLQLLHCAFTQQQLLMYLQQEASTL